MSSSTFDDIRQITTYTRPPGTHGCKLTEVVPGLFTAHFNDFKEPDAFVRLNLSPPIGLVVNSAVAYKQCDTRAGYYGPDIEVLPLYVLDDPMHGQPHTAPSSAKQYFELVNNKINATIDSGKSAMVHCMGSLSRSVVFIIAYLMSTKHLTAAEATAFLKAKWDATWPNDAFVHQLLEYEVELAAGIAKYSK